MDGWVYVLLGILIFAAAVGFYALVIRPWHMTWGSTPDERRRGLPADDLVRSPTAQATHGITIAAPAAEVWPWLVQIGQGRGGFYSYDWLENLFGCDIQNANTVLEEFQRLSVGDGVRLHPKSPPLSVIVVEPNRAIVLAGGRDLQPGMPVDHSFLKLHTYRGFTWAFILDEQRDQSTRFIVRVRVAWDRGLRHFFRSRLFLEPAHSIMQRKMNLGLKKRVEAHRAS